MNTRLYTIIITLFICFSLTISGCTKQGKVSDVRKKQVIVYAYDSFTTEWGAGPEICKRFTEKTGYEISMISAGDAAQVLSKAILEKDAPEADILLGLDNNMIESIKQNDVLVPYKPTDADTIIKEDLQLSSDWLLTPYDWSNFALIFNSEFNIAAPTCLEDLTKEDYKKKIILMDPRTSTPGLGFVAWTLAVFGDDYENYWRALKPNILTMSPGWDSGYGLFTSGEAPLVISYTTSAAYHVECENDYRFKTLLFPEGHTFQIEGAGLVKNAKNPEGAKAFLDFLISVQAQECIPLTQYMYPVNENVELPKSFEASPIATKNLTVDSNELNSAVERIMALLAE